MTTGEIMALKRKIAALKKQQNAPQGSYNVMILCEICESLLRFIEEKK